MNFKTIRKTVGTILCMEAAFMLAPLPGWLLLAVGDENYRRIFRRSAYRGQKELRKLSDSIRKQKGGDGRCLITMLPL